MSNWQRGNGQNGRRIKIQKPLLEKGEDDRLLEDVRKFLKLIPSEPEPNMGRIQEIKEEIKNGTYLTPEVLDETAARLAIRFMKPE